LWEEKMAGQDEKRDSRSGSSSRPKRDITHHQAPIVAPGTGEAVCPDCGGTGKLAGGEVGVICDGNRVVVPIGGA
jgi:hypothetical protein